MKWRDEPAGRSTVHVRVRVRVGVRRGFRVGDSIVGLRGRGPGSVQCPVSGLRLA